MIEAVLFLLGSVAVVALVLVTLSWWSRRSGRVQASAATALGYEFTPTDELPDDATFPLFERRRSRGVANVIRRPGDDDRSFEYHYELGAVDPSEPGASGNEWFACALVRTRFDAPPLTIVERGLLSRFGPGVEGERFTLAGLGAPVDRAADLDDDYRFYGDAAFATELLTPTFIGALTGADWKRTSISFGGPWMLCCSKERGVEARARFLSWAKELRDATS